MPSSEAVVRPVTDGDVAAVAALLGELGYATTDARLRARLGDGSQIFVAETGGAVVACMSLALLPYFADGSILCRVTALVVAATHRSRGIGAALIARAVDEARRHGCATLEVTTADRRTDAHRFYERAGFSRTSLRFVRKL